jgi:hypothetical protein
MKHLKTLVGLTVLLFGLVQARAQYLIETYFTNGPAIWFDASKTITNGIDMTFGYESILLRLTFNTNAPTMPTNIVGITLWDGSNKVAEVRGPLPPLSKYRFDRDLQRGDSGFDVADWQSFLNLSEDTQVDKPPAAGSDGFETITFGSKTDRASRAFAKKYGFKLPEGTNAFVFNREMRTLVNNTNIMKDYLLVPVPFIVTNRHMAAGGFKSLQVAFETTPNFSGECQVGGGDPTDYTRNFMTDRPVGTNTTLVVTQNFNPSRGPKIQFPIVPRLSIGDGYVSITGAPGVTTLQSSPNLKDWTLVKSLTLPKEGITFVPIDTSIGNLFFRTKQSLNQ